MSSPLDRAKTQKVVVGVVWCGVLAQLWTHGAETSAGEHRETREAQRNQPRPHSKKSTFFGDLFLLFGSTGSVEVGGRKVAGSILS